MAIVYVTLILVLILKTIEATCVTSKTFDLTFYIESSTNIILTCGTNSPVNAVISKHIIVENPKLIAIWDSYDGEPLYHCILTEYFFVPAAIVSAKITEYADDYITVKINDIEVSEIPSTAICTYQQNKDVTSYINPGLNKLFIDVYNTGGPVFFGYRIEIKTKFTV